MAGESTEGASGPDDAAVEAAVADMAAMVRLLAPGLDPELCAVLLLVVAGELTAGRGLAIAQKLEAAR